MLASSTSIESRRAHATSSVVASPFSTASWSAARSASRRSARSASVSSAWRNASSRYIEKISPTYFSSTRWSLIHLRKSEADFTKSPPETCAMRLSATATRSFAGRLRTSAAPRAFAFAALFAESRIASVESVAFGPSPRVSPARRPLRSAMRNTCAVVR